MNNPLVCYIGWHGHGNLGDDAIHTSVKNALPESTFIDLPLYPREIVRRLLRGLPHQLSGAALVLGGGTCLGRRNWRHFVQLGSFLTRSGIRYAIGAGVEDPTFGGYRSYSDRDELRRWKGVLEKFSSVSVRGPRSLELLSDVGIDSTVVGDPALLLDRPSVMPLGGRIGVNVGFGDDLWGHDPAAVADRVSKATSTLSTFGYEMVPILLNEGDRQWTAKALGNPDEVETWLMPASVEELIDDLAACDAVIVTRLHAGILAALSDTPTIALEYQPKCRDFALSVGNEQFLVRTDTFRAGDLVDLVESALGHRAEVVARNRQAVDTLRGRLAEAYASAQASICG